MMPLLRAYLSPFSLRAMIFTCQCACIYVFTCLCPCIYVPCAFCYLPCACALHAMCCVLRPRLCSSCHVLLQTFHLFIFLICVLAYWFRSDLDPMVFVIVHTPWTISKGLDHPILHVYACLLLCFMLVLASLVLGFATFDTLSRFVVMWLHLMPMRPCLGVTIWDALP